MDSVHEGGTKEGAAEEGGEEGGRRVEGGKEGRREGGREREGGRQQRLHTQGAGRETAAPPHARCSSLAPASTYVEIEALVH